MFSDKESHALDFFKAAGDVHISGYFAQQPAPQVDEDKFAMNWMFPELRSMSDGSVSTRITRIMKKLASSGKFPALPSDVSSGSIRVTALSELDAAGVWPHRMAAISGHDLKGWSAMWEYILITIASITPGNKLIILT